MFPLIVLFYSFSSRHLTHNCSDVTLLMDKTHHQSIRNLSILKDTARQKGIFHKTFDVCERRFLSYVMLKYKMTKSTSETCV